MQKKREKKWFGISISHRLKRMADLYEEDIVEMVIDIS